MRKSAIATAAIAGLTLFDIAAGSARAADLAVPVAPAAVGRPFGWTGFYIGALAEARFGSSGDLRASFDGVTFRSGTKAFLGGVYAGYDVLTWGNFISGMDASVAFGSGSRLQSLDGVVHPGGRTFNGGVVKVTDRGEGTLRGRFGYIIPQTNIMVFFASGLVLMDQELSHVKRSFPAGTWSGSQIRPGLTFGGGAEARLAALGGLIVRVEYLHNDFETTTYGDPLVKGWVSVKTQENEVRAGIAYAFSAR
jgi:opacity protein-like surface antigen